MNVSRGDSSIKGLFVQGALILAVSAVGGVAGGYTQQQVHEWRLGKLEAHEGDDARHFSALDAAIARHEAELAKREIADNAMHDRLNIHERRIETVEKK